MDNAPTYAAPRTFSIVDELDQAQDAIVPPVVLVLGWSCDRDLGNKSVWYRAPGLELARSRQIRKVFP